MRSPFNSIIGFSELLAKHTKSTATPESDIYIDFIQSSAKQTLTLLENLLIWAKSQTGQNPFNPIAINLSMMIRYAVDLSRSAANLKKIELNFIETDKVEVFADMNMLNTILRNLISNAIKYSHEQGVITISTLINNEKVEIRISDTGVGMSKETLNGIFAIDTTTTTAGTANEKGTGLGLVLCKELIEVQGGSISVQSEKGLGSEFCITLPLAVV